MNSLDRTAPRAEDTFDEVAEFLKAMGHPLRLRLVARLAEAPTHVNALAAAVDAPPAIVSQQLRILRMARLVAADRRDGLALYRLIDPRVVRLLHCVEAAHCATTSEAAS